MEESLETQEQVEKSSQESEKQTNRVFSQSETDRLVAEALKKEREKLGDVESVKKELEALRIEKKQREESEMSELQKVQSQLEEIAKAKEQLESENFNFKKSTKINEVLADAKYKELPKVYKNLVTYSDNFDEIVNSADKALEEYKADFGGKVKDSFGIPDTAQQAKTLGNLKINTSDGKNAVKAHIMDRLKGRM